MPDTLIIDNVERAAQMLLDGRLVAFPTETVYGLGADARDEIAVQEIYRAKGRPPDNPLIVHVHDLESVREVVEELPPMAEALLDAFSPGPLTIVAKRGGSVTPLVSAGLDTVAVRIPAHPLARQLLKACGIPVAAPSANLSGRPSPTRWRAVWADLDGRIDAVLKGGASEVGLESTVVDCSGAVPRVLRSGAVTVEELQLCRPDIRVGGGRPESSPGTRHPHYAPQAEVVLVEGPRPSGEAGYIGMDSPGPGYSAECVVSGPVEYARELYEFFRTCDARRVQRIDCQRPPEGGLGVALLDRLTRAAQGHALRS